MAGQVPGYRRDDPFCPYCNKFWHQAQPFIKDKRISMTTLLVGVIRPDSGQYAAAIIAADDPAKAWRDLQSSDGKIKPALKENTPREILTKFSTISSSWNSWVPTVPQPSTISIKTVRYSRSWVCLMRSRCLI